MKNEDLTKIKHVGASRMGLLNASGITTIKQLYNTAIEDIARIKTMGMFSAKLIKDAVTEYYEQLKEASEKAEKKTRKKKDKKKVKGKKKTASKKKKAKIKKNKN